MYETAHDLWSTACRRHGARPAFRHREASGWVSTTYAEGDTHAREIAAGLCGWGLGVGDRMCILAQTRVEWMLSDIACVLAGAVSVPIYASLTPDQCAYIVRNSGARFVIVEDAAQLEKLLPLVTGEGLHAIHIDGDAKLERPDKQGRTQVKLADVLAAAGDARARIRSWQEHREAGRNWLSGGHAEELATRAAAIKPDSAYTIIYTSGTTGTPKGVVIEHGCFTSSLGSACRALTIQETDEQYLFLPLAHVLARELVWASPFFGAVTSFSEGLTKIRDNLVEVRPTFMAGVPRIYEKFYTAVSSGMKQGSPVKQALVKWALGVAKQHSEALRRGEPGGGLQYKLADKLVFSKLRARLGLDRCRFLISGGAPLAAEIAEFFHGTGLLILEGYGLTETMSAAFVNRLDRYRFGTVGPALDVVECRIAEDGEILLKGPSIFKTYYQDPASTAEAIDAEVWFHTGDIGHLEDGFLRITDRKKDLIVLAGGKKVAPQPLENALKAQSPAVGQVMVYGDKQAYCVALVTPSEDAAKRAGGFGKAAEDPQIRAEVQAAVDAVNERQASFETIKQFALLPCEFTEATGELTPSLKVKRKVVVEKFRDEIAKLYQ